MSIISIFKEFLFCRGELLRTSRTLSWKALNQILAREMEDLLILYLMLSFKNPKFNSNLKRIEILSQRHQKHHNLYPRRFFYLKILIRCFMMRVSFINSF